MGELMEAACERFEQLADEAERTAFGLFLAWNDAVRQRGDGARLLRLSHRAERRRERREATLARIAAGADGGGREARGEKPGSAKNLQCRF